MDCFRSFSGWPRPKYADTLSGLLAIRFLSGKKRFQQSYLSVSEVSLTGELRSRERLWCQANLLRSCLNLDFGLLQRALVMSGAFLCFSLYWIWSGRLKLTLTSATRSWL